ncbi:MAG: ADP-ribosylglycohydrolase family protein [Anaerolineae bacterium]
MGDLASSVLYDKALGCLLGGLIGDAMGTPTEGKDPQYIEEHFGWVDDFDGTGTDDTLMKTWLAEALIETGGYATLDDWARTWVARWGAVTAEQRRKFFISVLHTIEKLRNGQGVPRMVALGNMPSSSTAMCISPVGIVNACNPRQAALQAYSLAALIHVQDVGFCQDGASAMAAAVAEAFCADATVESIIAAARAAILPVSGREMLERIDRILDLAQHQRDYPEFRQAVYDLGDSFLTPIMCDSRETIPLTLGLFLLAHGDLETAVIYCANLGRDADTIASMCGAIAGAYRGASGIRADWVDKARRGATTDQAALATQLVQTALSKSREDESARTRLNNIAGDSYRTF